MMSSIKLYSRKNFQMEKILNKILKYSNQISSIVPCFQSFVQSSLQYTTSLIKLIDSIQSGDSYCGITPFFKFSIETPTIFHFGCRIQWKSKIQIKCIQFYETYQIILEQVLSFFTNLSNLNSFLKKEQRLNFEQIKIQLKSFVSVIKRIVGMQNETVDAKKLILSDLFNLFKHISKIHVNNSEFLIFWKQNIVRITVFLKKFIKLNQFFSQIPSRLKKIELHTNSSENLFNQIELKFSKKNLKNFINQYVHTKINDLQICQNCEKMISFKSMEKHLLGCKQQYDTEQMIQKIDNQINVKLSDVNSYIMQIKKIQLTFQKIEIEQKNKIKSKKSRNRFMNKTYKVSQENYILNEFQIDQSQEEQKNCSSSQSKFQIRTKNKKKLKQLKKNELVQYLKLVEEIKFVGNKIKLSKKCDLYHSLKHIKQIVKPKLEEFNVYSEEVSHMLSLFLKRMDLILKQRKLNIQLKKNQGIHNDFNFINNEFENLQFKKSTELLSTKIKNKNKKKCREECFSDQQSSPRSSSIDNNDICLNDFKILRKLGEGTYGQVFLVIKKKTGVHYALKKIYIENLKKQTLSNLNTENNIFEMLNHPNITKALYSFRENDFHYFIMEYLPNGDLAQLILQETRLYQYQAKQCLAEIVLAIEHLHINDIIHKDLKPQNIIIDAEGHMKLTDFGLSESTIIKKKIQKRKSLKFSNFILKELKKKEKSQKSGLKKIVGSPYYMAPQMFKGQKVDYMADWWSFGVLIYHILLGIPPFLGKINEQIQQNIQKHEIWPQQVQFGDDPYEMISYEAKDLIDQLLQIDPKKRIGQEIQDIKCHSFFDGIDWKNLQKPNVEILQLVKERIPQKNKQEQHGYDTEQQYKSKRNYPNLNMGFSRRDLLINQTHIQHLKKSEKYQHLLSYAKNIAE